MFNSTSPCGRAQTNSWRGHVVIRKIRVDQCTIDWCPARTRQSLGSSHFHVGLDDGLSLVIEQLAHVKRPSRIVFMSLERREAGAIGSLIIGHFCDV